MSAAPDLRGVLGRHRSALAVLGLALLVLGTWMTASAYARPEPVRHVEATTLWTERASYAYAVPVTRNSTHHPIGTVLPMGEPAYFRTISDTLLVDFGWTIDSPGARGIAAAVLGIEIRAATADGRNLWSIEHVLAEAATQDVQEGLALSGRLDLDAIVEEATLVGKELPVGDGSVNWSIRTRVVYAIETPAGTDQGTVSHLFPIRAQDPRFVFPTPDALRWETPHVEESVTTMTRSAGWPGVLASVRGLALLVAATAVLGAVAATRPPGAGADFERELRRYRDWVSVAGQLPASARDPSQLVEVDTLQDLVHVAADARTRVLLDGQSRVFYALLPGVTYCYARHGRA